jgi:hypothetical protein
MTPTAARRPLPALDKIIVGLELLLGVGALIGGAMLIAGPDGHLLGLRLSLLEKSPFTTFLVPGVVLFTALGLVPLGALVMTVLGVRAAPLATCAVGALAIGWITTEMIMLSGFGAIAWAVYLVLGCAIAALGINAVIRSRRAAFLTRRP